MDNTLQLVRDQLNLVNVVPRGTVIRFSRNYTEQTTLTYVAVFVKGVWFLSGSFRNKDRYTNDAFFSDVLPDETVHDIELATGWEVL